MHPVASQLVHEGFSGDPMADKRTYLATMTLVLMTSTGQLGELNRVTSSQGATRDEFRM